MQAFKSSVLLGEPQSDPFYCFYWCNKNSATAVNGKSSYYAYQLNQLRHQRAEITEILLKGKWLHQAGFQAGEPVSVKVMHGCVVIIKNE